MAQELWDLWRRNCGICGAETVGSYTGLRGIEVESEALFVGGEGEGAQMNVGHGDTILSVM